VLYFLGMCSMMLDDYQKARDYFEDVITKYPGSEFKDNALVKTADCFFLEDDFDRAKPIYEKLKQDGGSLMPVVYLRLAQISMKEGRWSQKRSYMDDLRSKFPQSAEARFLEILKKYDDWFIIQVGAFTDEGNASVVKGDLLSKGFSAYVLNERGAAGLPAGQVGMLYKVRVGKYSDRKAAKRMAEQLMNEGYPARIIP
jgi:outer membrane protein assembly factor BamD (BamD/ComL family)